MNKRGVYVAIVIAKSSNAEKQSQGDPRKSYFDLLLR